MCFADFAGRGFVADSTTDIVAMSEETVEDMGSNEAGGTGEEDELRFAHRVRGNGVLCSINEYARDDCVGGVLYRVLTIIAQGSKQYILVGFRLILSVRRGLAILINIVS